MNHTMHYATCNAEAVRARGCDNLCGKCETLGERGNNEVIERMDSGRRNTQATLDTRDTKTQTKTEPEQKQREKGGARERGRAGLSEF